MRIPFFRYQFDPAALTGIEECLRSGWLTTGAKTKEFEKRFADYVGNGAEIHAVALNSCTAALHLALEAIGLRRGEIVIVPTMTFAATAEVVRYFDAIPVFVDADPDTLNLSISHLENTIIALQAGKEVPGVAPPYGPIRAIIPVHYGGQPCDMKRINGIATKHDIAVIEDAAHAFPAGWMDAKADSRTDGHEDAGNQYTGVSEGRSHSLPVSDQVLAGVRFVGGNTSRVTCFSFYANKTITTAEGGMAVTADSTLAERMRIMSLHGMNKDAWKRFSASGSWDYQLVAPGFKYNLTDIASAIGLAQLARAEEFRLARERISRRYNEVFMNMGEVEPLEWKSGVLHAHHLYVLKLRLDKLSINRAQFMEEMKARGVMCSVHWRPLHMHPYYVDTYGYAPCDFPIASELWTRLVSLPLFPSMTEEETEYVIESVRNVLM